MKRIAKFLLIVILLAYNTVLAADYRVLVVSDNLASKPCLDTFVYEDASEFFANQIINRLNLSGTVEAPTISEIREQLKRNQRLYLETRETLLRFKKEYNINYLTVQKLAKMYGVNKVLLLTTSADAQNYFIRRTFWDFLNIPGASVIDPAIKLSTYAVLIDTDRMVNIWEDTFYKTISACENRMVTTTLEPQTQQLEKVRDYSRMLGPQIAHHVQASIVPAVTLTKENEITYGPKDFDNVFTKKFRWYKHGAKEIAKETEYKYNEHRDNQRAKGIEPLPDKFRRWKLEYKQRQEAKKLEKARLKLEQEQQKHIQNINNVKTEDPKVEIKDSNIIEIKDVQKLEEKKKVDEKPKQQKQEEPKILNITKEEHIMPAVEEDKLYENQIKYYQPKQRIRPEAKNTTINDI